MEILIVAHGDAEANRRLAEEHELAAPILLLPKDRSVSIEAFDSQGTPSAYLLDGEGRVASPLAVGSVAVAAMAESVVAEKSPGGRSSRASALSTSKLVRDGIKAGTAAPTFELPDIRGGTVSLEEYRGRRVLLVFTDPNCGPCEQLAPQLVRLHEQADANDPAIILVGRGDPRRTAARPRPRGSSSPW